MGMDPAMPASGRRPRRFRDLFEHAPVAYLVTDAMGVSADEAFALIRSTARSGNRRVADVAGDVIAGLVPEQ
jgi:fructose-1,6-bisphosphatase